MKKLVYTLAMFALGMQAQAQTTVITEKDGKVGIGTPEPISKLDITSGVYKTYFTGNALTFKNSNEASYIDKRDVGSLRFRMGANYSTAMTIDSRGYVGIGTSSPASRFDVTSGSYKMYFTGNALAFKNNNQTSYIDKKDTGSLYFRMGASNATGMVLTSDLRLGVGTASPSEKLEVYKSTTAPGVLSLRSSRNDAQHVDVGRLVAKQGTKEVSRIAMPRAGGTYTGYLTFWTKETNDSPLKESMRINEKGNVGIGANSPESNLQIGSSTTNGLIMLGGGKGYSAIGSTRSDGGIILGKNIYARYKDATDNLIGRVGKGGSTGFAGIKIGQNGLINFFGKKGVVAADEVANSKENTRMTITTNGDVGIGTLTTGGHKLAVHGTIGAREIKVESRAWPDYVFTKDYNLPTLKEVENHIKEKGHLPNIPSAKEVEENKGIELGEMNRKLLEKVEELTLYVIQQQKEINELKRIIKKDKN